jgi:glycogen phosphorylase
MRRLRQVEKSIIHDDLDPVRRICVFTTHTPVPAGHDQFPMELVARVLGRREIYDMKEVFCCEGVLNMTFLAANLSHYINGVAKRHGEISRHMFSRYVIDAITNGVHAGTSSPFPHGILSVPWLNPKLCAFFRKRWVEKS